MPYYDLHLHTTYSDGKASIAEMLFAAEHMGLSHIAITDHCKNADVSWLDRALADIAREEPRYTVKVLRGMEVLVLDRTGRLAITEQDLGKLDIVLAEIAGATKIQPETAGADRQTLVGHYMTTLLNTIRNPRADIIAHPFNFDRHYPAIALADFTEGDLERLADGFVKHRKAFEIMNNIWWWYPHVEPKRFYEDYVRILKLFAQHGVIFSLGSDAHSIGGVGNLIWTQRAIRAAGIAESQILNPDVFINRRQHR